MINAIRGKAIEITDNSIVVLTEGGVEYYLEVSTNTANQYRSMSTEERKSVRVLAVLQHREDAMTLFGFYDEKERFTFSELLNVPGIGPKGAIKILSGITVDDLAVALDLQDVKKLAKVPGLGAKTAQKLILQLRNVLVFEEETTKEDKAAGKITARFSELINSFTEMGYDRKSVVKGIEEVLAAAGDSLNSLSDRDIEKKIFSSVLRRLN